MIKAEVSLKPFRVPSYVLVEQGVRPRQEGIGEDQKFHISELSVQTLELLCDQFKRDVFEKAGKPLRRCNSLEAM